MLVTILTDYGPRKIRVCDHCKTVCIPSGRFCSGRCAAEHERRLRRIRDRDGEVFIAQGEVVGPDRIASPGEGKE